MQENKRLLGLRALRRHLSKAVGELDRGELRRLVESGALPCVRLRGADGGIVYGFDPEAVEAELLRRARGLPKPEGDR